MAVPFSNTKLRVPKGFQNVLEGLAREVLRNQPENLYEFGAKYFEQMLSVRDETGHDPAVHGARLEDRFYNNDSFKSPVVDSGDPQQQDAALKIQTEFRRHAAVKEVETMQEEDAALTIQSSFRGHQEREKVKQMIVEKSAVSKEEEEVDIDLEDPDVEKAAIKIQAGFKGFKARKEVKEEQEKREETKEEEIDIDLTDPEVEKAATKIQAGFRGHKTRQDMKGKTESEAKVDAPKQDEEEVDIDLNDPEVEKAATKIQAGFRGHKTRKEMQSREKDESAPTEEKKEESAPTETKTEETVQTEEKKEEKKEEEVDIDLDDPNTENAALKIQAGFRGYKTRKELQGQTKDEKPSETDSKTETKEETKTDSKGEEVDIDLNDPEVEKAATKIQAGFKGYKTRKDMKDKPEDSSGEKKEEEEKKVEALRITLNPQQASTVIDVLSAFPSFKKPKDLPDHLRLSKLHIRRVRKWRKSAMENLKNPTFEKTNKLTIKAFKLFENEGMFEKDKKEVKESKNEEGKEQKSEQSEDEEEQEEEGQAHVFEDSSSDEDETFDGFDFNAENPEFEEKMTDMMGDLFGTLLGGDQLKSQADKTGKEKLMQSATNMIPMLGGMASKPVMYKPYKAMTEALEKWIDENVSLLPGKELEARGKQLQIMKDICAKYEEQDLDEKGNYEVRKEANIEILEMMGKVESVGGKLPPEVAAKGETGFELDNFEEVMPDIMHSLGDGLATMFKGLGALGNAKTKQKEDGDEVEEDVDSCTIL